MDYNKLQFDVDDHLSRKKFVENLMRVIGNWNKLKKENDSLVVSVDASWGSGKSYLLGMWKNWLLSKENADNNYAVAYYNAWKDDDNDNAFIPLAYALQQREIFGENEELLHTFEEKTRKFMKACAIAFVKDLQPESPQSRYKTAGIQYIEKQLGEMTKLNASSIYN